MWESVKRKIYHVESMDFLLLLGSYGLHDFSFLNRRTVQNQGHKKWRGEFAVLSWNIGWEKSYLPSAKHVNVAVKFWVLQKSRKVFIQHYRLLTMTYNSPLQSPVFLDLVHRLEFLRNFKNDISKANSASVFRYDKTNLVSALDRAILNHWLAKRHSTSAWKQNTSTSCNREKGTRKLKQPQDSINNTRNTPQIKIIQIIKKALSSDWRDYRNNIQNHTNCKRRHSRLPNVAF
jgi:hypothetical protein